MARFGTLTKTVRPHAVFFDTDCDSIDRLLSKRSPCRGAVDASRTYVVSNGSKTRFGIDKAGFDAMESNRDQLDEMIRKQLECMPSCQAAVIYHASKAGAGAGLGKWIAKKQGDFGFDTTLALQLMHDAKPTVLNGLINSMNEVNGLFNTRSFDMRVLISDSAVHKHRVFKEGRRFTPVNQLITRACAPVTACARPGR